MPRKAGNLRKQFIIEYLIDLNATQAAIRAGYSPHTAKSQGQRLLTNVDLRAQIDQALNERAKRVELTADYVLSAIMETVERCRQAEPVFDNKGNPLLIETATGEYAAAYRFDPVPLLKGAELLGKHLKMFTDKLQIEITDKREVARSALEKLQSTGISETEAVEQLVGLGVDREDLQTA